MLYPCRNGLLTLLLLFILSNILQNTKIKVSSTEELSFRMICPTNRNHILSCRNLCSMSAYQTVWADVISRSRLLSFVHEKLEQCARSTKWGEMREAVHGFHQIWLPFQRDSSRSSFFIKASNLTSDLVPVSVHMNIMSLMNWSVFAKQGKKCVSRFQTTNAPTCLVTTSKPTTWSITTLSVIIFWCAPISIMLLEYTTTTLNSSQFKQNTN